MATMRAVDIKNGKGPATSLFINTIPRPQPTGNQALIRVKAFGLNRMDLMQREGNYPVPPQAPSTLGVEFSGTIDSFSNPSSTNATSGSTHESGFKIGDQVFGLAYGGAYAEYICVSTKMLIHKPSELSFEECAGIPEVWITALQAMYLVGDFAPGKSILWHAGASAVSIAGIQLSKAHGASKIFATTRSDEKNQFLKEKLGVDAAFNSDTSEDWSQDLLKETDGKGADVIIDFMGGSFFGKNLKAAAFEGRIVNLAPLTGVKPSDDTDLSLFFRKRIRFEGSTLRARDETYQGKLRDRLVDNALPKFKDGSFKVYVEKVMDWESIVEAHQLMESNQTKGKIIMTIP